jgi:hypothetical protein
MSMLLRRIFHGLLCSSLALVTGGCLQNTELQFNDSNAAKAAGRIPASAVEDYSLELPITKRHYVVSVFHQVFAVPVPSTDADDLTAGIYQKKEFGGSCDPYGVSEITVNGTLVREFLDARCGLGITADLKATSNPMRYAWTAKACENMIVNKPARFAGAMSQILTGWSAGSSLVEHRPSAESVKRAYGLFFRGREPDSADVDALLQVGQSAGTNDDAWRLILITLCVNPEWQSLI